MNDGWLGKTVSLDCGQLGFFQGVIKSVQLEDQTITIKNGFQNGVPIQRDSITLRAGDINDLKFVEATKNAEAQSIIQVKKRNRPVSENLISSSAALAAKSPSQSYNRKVDQPSAFNQFYGQRGGQRAPNSRNDRLSKRNEDCFGQQIFKEDFTEDFDFEKNLALFDKRTVFEEIDASNPPDVIRLVDINRKKPSPVFIGEGNEPKYRNDQNVIDGVPINYRQIKTNQKDVEGEYVTDSGLFIPSIDLTLRNRLMAAAEARGFSHERITELIARSGTEVAIQLLGGERRLTPSNSHQYPLAVVLCGPGKSGSYGLAIGRHLASQGVRVIAFIPELSVYQSYLASELNLFKLCCKGGTKIGSLIHTISDLPKGLPVDLIVQALDDHDMYLQERKQDWHKVATKWVLESRAPVLTVDPIPMTASHAKASILPGLPIWHPHNSAGRVYLVNLGLPAKIFKDVGIVYASPFGAKTSIALSAN